MPPLEEDEAIAELDAAIDEAGDKGEEGPEPLDNGRHQRGGSTHQG